MESTISTRAARLDAAPTMCFHAGLGDQPGGRRLEPQAAGAQRDLLQRFLARGVQHRPRALSAAAACSISVDFPIPGSPPIKVTEPGTKPAAQAPDRALSIRWSVAAARRWPRRPMKTRHRSRGSAPHAAPCADSALRYLGHQGVPLAATSALPLPFWRRRSAVLADKHLFGLRHGLP